MHDSVPFYELLRPNKQDVPIEQSVGMSCLRCKFESATIEASASDITRVWYLGSASRSGSSQRGMQLQTLEAAPRWRKPLFHRVPGRQLSVFGRSNDQEAAYEIRETVCTVIVKAAKSWNDVRSAPPRGSLFVMDPLLCPSHPGSASLNQSQPTRGWQSSQLVSGWCLPTD